MAADISTLAGRLGSAILSGLLRTLGQETAAARDTTSNSLPTRFLACVRTSESEARLEHQFKEHLNAGPTKPAQPAKATNGMINGNGLLNTMNTPTVEVWRGRNTEAVRQASVVLLACQPPQLPVIIAEDGLATAMHGKLVLNICAGISESMIRDHIYRAVRLGSLNNNKDVAGESHQADGYYIVHAMPNAASTVGESETIISPPDEAGFPAEYDALVNWIFGCIGTVTEVAPDLMNAASITAGCTVGFLAPALQGITAGAVTAGLDEAVALRMAAQAMKGTAEMVLALGEKPAKIMDKVATPGGCTEKGLQVLLAGAQRGSVSMAYEVAIREAIARAFELGSRSSGSKAK
ncbi:MAG: hypothetical protein Q9227_002109 [Pyrenula ochraceoflavens]